MAASPHPRVTRERFEQVARTFEAVLERPVSERAALLAELCGSDEPLRRAVDNLIASDAQASGFLEPNMFEPAPPALNPDEAAGQRIGPYRVIREIGHGGMGTVYLAARDDNQYHKQVAIKVINRGMDSDFILRRFRNERQILAHLDHPNIARLLDGGITSDALPFFVMEYLEGRPITEYCDEHALDIDARLKLFRIVCGAVHYAHQNLVIHRDLKPNNVVVTSAGVPKLLDFGIAKLLGPREPAENPETETIFRILTPEYASPEQVCGGAMTTASDVYGLGVLLYELLTGRRPYRFTTRSPEQIAQIIREQEPGKPSASVGHKLRRRLRGDLDNIVLMALRKDPHRRYASAEQLGEDIGRFLDGCPVLAHRDTLAYRATKFARRYQAAVIAATLVVVTLFAGSITTMQQARRAEHRFNQVRALANSFVFEFHDAIQSLPGSTPARALVVERALTYLDSLAQEAGDDPVLLRELAAAYQKLGDVQSRLHRSNLGNTQGAMDSYQKALSIRRALFAADPSDLQLRLDLSVSYGRAGDVLSKTNDVTAALANYRTSLRLIEEAPASQAGEARTRSAAALAFVALGRAVLKTGDDGAALAAFRQSTGLFEALLAERPADIEIRRNILAGYQGVGFVLASTGDAPASLEIYRRSATIAETLASLDAANGGARRTLMDAYEWVALSLRQNGDLAAALDYHRKARTLALTLLESDPSNAQARNDIGDIHHELGNTLTAMGHLTGALDNFRQSIRDYESVAIADPADANARRQVAATRRQMADALALAGDTMPALREHRAALMVFVDLASQDPANSETQHDVALSYRAIGSTLATSEPSGALEQFGQAVPILTRVSEKSPLNMQIRANLADLHARIGAARVILAARAANTRSRQALWLEAHASYQRAHELYVRLMRKGTLGVEDETVIRRIARQIDRCAAAIRVVQ